MAVCVEAKARCIKTQLWEDVTSQKGGRLWTDVRYWPSTQLEEKKQMLRVSRGFSWVNSGERVWGSDSPVREELSTSTGRHTETERVRETESVMLRQQRGWGQWVRMEVTDAVLISTKCSTVTPWSTWPKACSRNTLTEEEITDLLFLSLLWKTWTSEEWSLDKIINKKRTNWQEADLSSFKPELLSWSSEQSFRICTSEHEEEMVWY